VAPRGLTWFDPPVSRPLLLAAAVLLAGCTPSTVTTLSQRPRGKEFERLTWTATAVEPGPRHRATLSIVTDPAKLMGWARRDVQYRGLFDVAVTGPDGTTKATLTVPITERKIIGEDKAANTIKVTFDAAGEVQPDGFGLVPPQRALDFAVVPGDYELSVRVRMPKGGNKQALWAVREVRLELQARDGAKGRLTTWAAQPPVIDD